MPLCSITISLPAGLDDERAGSFASALCGDGMDGAALAGTAVREGRDHRGAWSLQWLFCEPPPLVELLQRIEAVRARLTPELSAIKPGNIAVETLPEEGWLERSYKAFPPFRESGFYIYGSHIETPEPGNDIPLLIDAATAFGSGEHGTTAGCLELMAGLKQEGWTPARALDLGTGSGILAVAAWKLWRMPVLATDIDPEAVRVASLHRDLNHVPADMECLCSDGFAAAKVQHKSAFDLVIANILAGPLKEMAHAIKTAANQGGHIILSGMLKEQMEDVLRFYCDAHCTIKKTVSRGDWVTVLLTTL